MAKRWAELTTQERLDAILVAVGNLNAQRYGTATAANVAMEVNRVHELPRMEFKRSRVPSMATRVTSGIVSLRRAGLLTWASRADGLSGTADALTDAGRQRMMEVLAEREGE